MFRRVIAVIAGLITGSVVVASIEATSHAVFPSPAGLDFQDAVALREFVTNLPLGALLMVLAAWTLGALTGGLVSAAIVRDREYGVASVVAAVQLAAAIANLATIPHPLWFVLVSLPLIPLAALGGAQAVRAGRRARPDEATEG